MTDIEASMDRKLFLRCETNQATYFASYSKFIKGKLERVYSSFLFRKLFISDC